MNKMKKVLNDLRRILDKLDTIEARLLYLSNTGIDCQDALASVTNWRKIVQFEIAHQPIM